MSSTVNTTGSSRFGDTIAAVLLVILLYPMSVAPTGALSNGGLIGLCSLIGATFFSCRAFLLNGRSR